MFLKVFFRSKSHSHFTHGISFFSTEFALKSDQHSGCFPRDAPRRFFEVFLWDPLEAQPHDPDVRALLRIAVVYDIPVANNLATADFLLTSKFMDETYERRVENFNVTIQERVKAFQK